MTLFHTLFMEILIRASRFKRSKSLLAFKPFYAKNSPNLSKKFECLDSPAKVQIEVATFRNATDLHKRVRPSFAVELKAKDAAVA